MKKILLYFAFFIILTGCSVSNMENTPTLKVENYLNQYQMLDQSVLDDLDAVLANDTTLSDSDREDYREFMKKHYQDLKYEIKDETIDGDNASVEVEIMVRNYSDAVLNADDYRSENVSDFNDANGNYDYTLFSAYRLEEMKKVEEVETYTLNLTLTKQDDEWILNQLSDADLNKINGLYAG